MLSTKKISYKMFIGVDIDKADPFSA